MSEVTIRVSKDGSTQVEVQGVAGAGCRDLTAALEKALGHATTTELTSDYYQTAEESQREVAQ